MSRNDSFSNISNFSKIKGVAEIKWKLRTATPLCIKSGTTSSWNQATKHNLTKPNKLRLHDATFDFFKKDENKDDDASVSDFYHDAYIKAGELKPRYRIPASSVRGALRGYTLKRLVPKDLWNAEAKVNEKGALERDKKKSGSDFKKALMQPGWHLIQNFFGIAADDNDEALADESVAGRLQVSVGDLHELSIEEFKGNLIYGSFKSSQSLDDFGPANGKMVITTRNPLDKITNAAKDGGLHSFMELAAGNDFEVTIKIINPVPEDLGIIGFWENGLKTGLLRLGGLTTVGRGRLDVMETSVRLFIRGDDEDFKGLNEITGDSGDADDSVSNDVLNGVFNAYTLDWKGNRGFYLSRLEEFYNNSYRAKEISNG